MNRLGILILIWLLPAVAVCEWIAPSDPDVEEIYRSIHKDIANENFEDALKKHVWFYDNVLKIDESYYGVRLSFALASWIHLSTIYSPAMEALEEKIQIAEEKIRTGDTCCKSAFHDFASINRELNRESETVRLFVWLDVNNPQAAKRNFNLAKPALITLKNYQLILKYLDPDAEFYELRHEFNRNYESREKFSRPAQFEKYMYKSYTYGITTLVALLVIGQNIEKAQEIVEDSQLVFSSEEFKNELEKALNGNVPDSWP